MRHRLLRRLANLRFAYDLPRMRLHRNVFETWLEKCLIPVLQPGQVVIMDNATFDKGGRIKDLIESVGCRLLYLPPYSPDLNRIEKCWGSASRRSS